MKKRAIVLLGLVLMVFLVPAVVFAQGSVTEDMNYSQVRAKFVNWTNLDAQLNGYVRDPFCIDASLIGQPELGAMAFHAGNESLIDDEIQTSQPEVLLLDAGGNVVAVEYITTATEQPVFTQLLAGEEIAFDPPPPEMEHGWSLHVWLIPNPSGITSPWNPNATCPEGSLPPGPPPTGDLTLPWAYLALAGAVALLLGFGALRRAAKRA